MTENFKNLRSQALEPETHAKILVRAGELVALGWTTGAGARNERAEPVQGTSPAAISWCLTAAVFHALFEIVGIDCYQDRNASVLDSVNFWWKLMRPIHGALAARGFRDHIVDFNDRVCTGAADAEALLREAADQV